MRDLHNSNAANLDASRKRRRRRSHDAAVATCFHPDLIVRDKSWGIAALTAEGKEAQREIGFA